MEMLGGGVWLAEASHCTQAAEDDVYPGARLTLCILVFSKDGAPPDVMLLLPQ